MTHIEPISVIVWQGNNITEPINILRGAALLMEQQDVALSPSVPARAASPGKARPWCQQLPGAALRVKDT